MVAHGFCLGLYLMSGPKDGLLVSLDLLVSLPSMATLDTTFSAFFPYYSESLIGLLRAGGSVPPVSTARAQALSLTTARETLVFMASDKRQGWNQDISGCLCAQMCHAVAWSVDWEIVSKGALKIGLGGKLKPRPTTSCLSICPQSSKTSMVNFGQLVANSTI